MEESEIRKRLLYGNPNEDLTDAKRDFIDFACRYIDKYGAIELNERIKELGYAK